VTNNFWNAFTEIPKILKLYGYWRSSASWRVRWALELKKRDYEYVPINLLKGENTSERFLTLNPQGRLPALEIDGTFYLTQSMAIVEWIEETYRGFGDRLLPDNPLEKAHVRSLCEIINADTTPLQLPRVQKAHSADTEERKKWAQLFIRQGLQDFEKVSEKSRGKFSSGDAISMADVFLIPQLYNANRYEISVAKEFPALDRIYQEALKTEACQLSSPEAQSDAQP
jgi:maleylacetoacetate isomerase